MDYETTVYLSISITKKISYFVFWFHTAYIRKALLSEFVCTFSSEDMKCRIAIMYDLISSSFANILYYTNFWKLWIMYNLSPFICYAFSFLYVYQILLVMFFCFPYMLEFVWIWHIFAPTSWYREGGACVFRTSVTLLKCN